MTTTSSQEQGKAPPASALDSALSEIQGPKAMSTITKSSIDWDNFKEKEGIEEELETAGQDGYAAVARSLLVPQLLMLGGAPSPFWQVPRETRLPPALRRTSLRD